MTTLEVVCHTALAGLVLIGYVVLTALGEDGSLLLGVLVGQGAAAGTSALARDRT